MASRISGGFRRLRVGGDVGDVEGTGKPSRPTKQYVYFLLPIVSQLSKRPFSFKQDPGKYFCF